MKCSESRLVLLQLRGLYSPRDSPGQNIGAGSLSFLQGNLPNPGIEPRSPAVQVDSLPAEPQGESGEREQQPTPVFLPGESHGQGSLVGYCPWGKKESDKPE